MHEQSLMQNLLRRIAQAAGAERAARVQAVSVRLGALSHMSPEHFREHFLRASAGTLAEGARLDITASDVLDDPAAADVLLTGIEVET